MFRQILLFFIFAPLLMAQEFILVSRDTVQTEAEIIDLFIEDGTTLLLTADGDILEVQDDGQVVILETNNKKGFYERKIGGALPKEYDMDLYIYFCSWDDAYYACYWDWSYSSRIVRIEPLTGEESQFTFITGIPSGMYSTEGKLQYLSNMSDGTRLLESILRYYNPSNPICSFELLIPVLDAKGLYVDPEGVFTTYENNSNTLIGFTIDETHVNRNYLDDTPSYYQLEQNYPNPFNIQTNISFILNKSCSIDLHIYNIRGEVIKTLIERTRLSQGAHTINWEGINDFGVEVPSGMYVYELVIDGKKYASRPMILSK